MSGLPARPATTDASASHVGRQSPDYKGPTAPEPGYTPRASAPGPALVRHAATGTTPDSSARELPGHNYDAPSECGGRPEHTAHSPARGARVTQPRPHDIPGSTRAQHVPPRGGQGRPGVGPG